MLCFYVVAPQKKARCAGNNCDSGRGIITFRYRCVRRRRKEAGKCGSTAADPLRSHRIALRFSAGSDRLHRHPDRKAKGRGRQTAEAERRARLNKGKKKAGLRVRLKSDKNEALLLEQIAMQRAHHAFGIVAWHQEAEVVAAGAVTDQTQVKGLQRAEYLFAHAAGF